MIFMFECYEDVERFIGERFTQLRSENNMSARDLSLSIGQSAAYINNIENKNSLPSLKGIFYVCEHFKISLKDFFDVSVESPGAYTELAAELKGLDEEALRGLLAVVRNMKK